MNKKCPVCNSSNYTFLFSKNGFDIRKCKKCGLAKTFGEQKINYKKYHRDHDYKKFESHFRNIFKKRFEILNKYKIKGKVLDIGTSTGTMLDIFAQEGWETYGVEPSNNYKIAKSKNHKIYNTTFEKAKLKNNFFDLIILNHTLEHVKDPNEVVEKAYKLLKIDGLLLIDVPNFGSYGAKLQKANWKYLLPNEHLYHFDENSLKYLLKKNKFKVLQIQSRSGIFDTANPLKEIFESLVTLKKRFFSNLFFMPLNLIETITNNGGAITIVGKKYEN